MQNFSDQKDSDPVKSLRIVNIQYKCPIYDPGLGQARLIEISVNRSIYKRKTIIDMKIQESVTFNGSSVNLFN